MTRLTSLDAALLAVLLLVVLYFVWQLRDNWLIALEMRAYANSKPLIPFLVEYARLVRTNAVKSTLWALLGVNTAILYGSQLLTPESPIRLLPQPLGLVVLFVGAVISTQANRGTIRYVRSVRPKRGGEPRA